MTKVKKKKPIENKVNKSKEKEVVVNTNKTVVDVINKINKKFGKNSARLGAEIEKSQPLSRIPTGNVSLDIDLGGGIPLGRYSEISGAFSSTKTTQCLHIMRNALNMGLVVSFHDAEGTSGDEYGQPDKAYFDSLGIDVNSFIYNRPDSLEEVTEMILDLQKSGEVHLAIWDSIAMTEPNKVLESAMEDTVQMGIKQKILNEFFSKYQLNNNRLVREGKKPFTLICTNQLREKIGTMYGCLHADTKICFIDGRSYSIREIVENKIEGEVYSYNEETKKIESKNIIDWHYNGDIESKKDYIYIRSYCPENKNGTSAINVTPDHEVLTDKGWLKAKNINMQNKLVTKVESKLNGTLLDFLYGSIVGDSHVFTKKYTSCLRLKDSENDDYLKWKVAKLNHAMNFKRYKNNLYESHYMYDLYKLTKNLVKRNPLEYINKMTYLSLAIWYCDDGHFRTDRNTCSINVKRYSNTNTIQEISNQLNKHFNLNTKVYLNEGSLVFNKQDTITLHKNICKYVPESMQYKLLNEYKNKYEEFTLTNESIVITDYVPILEIRECSNKQFRQRGKYDITIQDNHNYIAGGKHNGVIVHNSPEYTPGGRAKGFASSVEIRLRQGDLIAEDKQVVGQVVKYKISKNKTYMRLKSGEFDMYLDENTIGVPKFYSDNVKSIIVQAVSWGVIKKGGSWFYLNDEKFQGLDATIDYIKENPRLIEEIKTQVLNIASKVK